MKLVLSSSHADTQVCSEYLTPVYVVSGPVAPVRPDLGSPGWSRVCFLWLSAAAVVTWPWPGSWCLSKAAPPAAGCDSRSQSSCRNVSVNVTQTHLQKLHCDSWSLAPRFASSHHSGPFRHDRNRFHFCFSYQFKNLLYWKNVQLKLKIQSSMKGPLQLLILVKLY